MHADGMVARTRNCPIDLCLPLIHPPIAVLLFSSLLFSAAAVVGKPDGCAAAVALQLGSAHLRLVIERMTWSGSLIDLFDSRASGDHTAAAAVVET